MMLQSSAQNRTRKGISKTPTGIPGLDNILQGGLPLGRPTLVSGGSGTGKTLLGMHILIAGARDFEEPGVFFSFEENSNDLELNAASFGFDLPNLIQTKRIYIEDVRFLPAIESGKFTLDALFVRLDEAIAKVNAKRLVLDTVETLINSFDSTTILRAEVKRLFDWLRTKNITTIVTAEIRNGELSRYGFEEYVSDCVIQLNQQVTNRVSTRTLRVLKYRGSAHGSNEYPFLIGDHGFSVQPITEVELVYPVSNEKISTGIPGLDKMMQGGGYFIGSSILISGTAGTGKSSIAAHFVNHAAQLGIKGLYFSFEESPEQIARNMKSIGINLQQWIESKILAIHSIRPTQAGLETHLVGMQNVVMEFNPGVVVMDPISGFYTIGKWPEIHAMLNRFIYFLKKRSITCVLTQLVTSGALQHEAEMTVPSTIDTWIVLRGIEVSGEFDRVLHIVKSRGMEHSNQVREFVFTTQGVDLINVYLGPAGMLTGSARVAQETQERRELTKIHDEIEAREESMKRQREALDAKLKAERIEFEVQEDEAKRAISEKRSLVERMEHDQRSMAKIRRTEEFKTDEAKKRTDQQSQSNDKSQRTA